MDPYELKPPQDSLALICILIMRLRWLVLESKTFLVLKISNTLKDIKLEI